MMRSLVLALLFIGAAHAQTISVDDVNGTPTGPAGGDLTSTYPNPSVASVGGKAVTLGGTLTTSGAFNTTFTMTGGTTVTFPTSGTLSTLGTNTFTGAQTAPALISAGTKFTTSGCSVSSTTGGAAAGTFTIGANNCTVVVTINGATGLTAPNGWSCAVEDTSALTILISQSASTTATASFPVPVTAGATDVLKFFCMGY